jgi:hypothetical protein
MSEKLLKLTIKPTPANSQVIFDVKNYEPKGNSIEVPMGTTVSYEVSHKGYYTKKETVVVEKTVVLKESLIKIEEVIDLSKEKVVPKRDLRDIYPKEFSNRRLINEFTTYVTNNLFEKSREKYINGYIGERSSGDSKTDYYVQEPTKARQLDQIVPVVKTSESNITFMNFINSLNIEGSYIRNQNNLLSENCWSWTPPIDADMFLNYGYYYWIGNDEENMPTIELLSETDIIQEIDGKSTFSYKGEVLLKDGTVQSEHTLEFMNGMRIIFRKDVNEEYNNVPFILTGVGESIVLIDDRNVANAPKSEYADPDYFVMERNCRDGNKWSEHNRWVHKSVIEIVDANLVNVLKQAKFPILCYNKDIELYDYGTFDRGYVDVAFDGTSQDINGKVIAEIDKIPVASIKTILCLGQTESENKQQLFNLSVVEKTGLIILQPLMNGQRNISGNSSYTTKGDVVKINKGKYGDTSLYYDGEKWKTAQKKELNKTPLFNLYDKDKVVLSNEAVYLNSSFAGCTIFDYEIPDTSKTYDDLEIKYSDELGRRILVGDNNNYQFENTIKTGSYKYVPAIGEDFKEIGGYKFYKINGEDKYLNDWHFSPSISQQMIKTQFTVTDSNLLNGKELTIALEVKPDIQENQKTIYVRKNGELLDSVKGEYTLNGSTLVIKSAEVSDVFDIKFFKRIIDKALPNGYIYEEPLSMTVNPTNEDISTIKYNNCFDQMVSIIESQKDFTGSSLGLNNYFNIKRDLSVGIKILQHSSPIIRSMILNDKDTTSVRNSIEFVNNEYNRFKLKFINVITEYFKNGENGLLDDEYTYDKFLADPEKLDNIIADILETRINIGKEGLKPFYNNGVLSSLDIIENAYVPATPAYLGISDVYEPKIIRFENSIKENKPNVIVGHDGSKTVCFGDVRDLCLLRLETLIYNSINFRFKEEEFKPMLSKHKVIPGKFRDVGYTREEFISIYSPFLEKWCDKNDHIYSKNYSFNINDWKTWNWSSVSSTTGEKLFGSYRAIYNYYYDTYTPHTTPWEMLGFSKQPSWWEETYGKAPYTSMNIQMWSDIERGLIVKGEHTGEYVEFKRPQLVEKYLPVDDEGNLLNPVEAGIASVTPLMSLAKQDWLVGDMGEIEFAYQQTSSYLFDIQCVLYLLKPTYWVETNWDTTNLEILFKNTSYEQCIDRNTGMRNSLSTIVVHNEVVDGKYVRNIGIQQWISDYLTSNTMDITQNLGNVLRNAIVKLGYRCAGFYQQGTIQLLSDVADILPESNYSIELFKSKSGKLLTYSGVIIEKTTRGFKVSGFDKSNPYFKVRLPYKYGKKTSFTENGKTIHYYKEWKSDISVVPYKTEFTLLQDVYDFIIGYGKYLTENEGWYFSNRTSTGEVLSFTKSGETFVKWATNFGNNSNEERTLLVLNPGVLGLGLYHNGVVEDMGQRVNGYWATLDIYGNPIKNEDLSVFRQSFNTYFTPNNKNIALLRAQTYEYEHILLIDNETIYGDVLYNPLYSSVITRLKLTGIKVKNWYGNTYAPGYVVQDGGAIPNLEKNASDLNYAFDTDDIRCQGAIAEYAKGTIGYSETPAFKNLLLNKQTMFDFYKGLLKEKGTIKPIQKLNRSDYVSTTGDKEVELYENWAFKLGEFGHISDNAEIEFLLDTEKMSKDPQIITFESLNNYYWDKNKVYKRDEFVIYDAKEFKCTNTTSTKGEFRLSEWEFIRRINNYTIFWDDSKWLKKPDSKTFKSFNYGKKDVTYPVGGFVNLEDVDYIVADEQGLIDIKDTISKGQTVLVVKTENGDWDIRRKTGVSKFVSLRYNTLKEAYDKESIDYVYSVSDNKITYYTDRNSETVSLNTKLYTDIDMEKYACTFGELTKPVYTLNRDYKYVAGTNYKVKLKDTVFYSPVPEDEVQRDTTLMTLVSKSTDTEKYDFPYSDLLPVVKNVDADDGAYYYFELTVNAPLGSDPQVSITRTPVNSEDLPEIKKYDKNVKKITLVCYEGDKITFTASANHCKEISNADDPIVIKDGISNQTVNLCWEDGEVIVDKVGEIEETVFAFYKGRGRYTIEITGAGGGAGGSSWKKKKKKKWWSAVVAAVVGAVLAPITFGASLGISVSAMTLATGVALAAKGGIVYGLGGAIIGEAISYHKVNWTSGAGAGSGAYIKATFDFHESKVTKDDWENIIGYADSDEDEERLYYLASGVQGTGGNYGNGAGANGVSGGVSYFRQGLNPNNKAEVSDILKAQGGAGGWGSNSGSKVVSDYEWTNEGVSTTNRKCGAGGSTFVSKNTANPLVNCMVIDEENKGNSAQIKTGSNGAQSVHTNGVNGYGASPNPANKGNPGSMGSVVVTVDEIYERPKKIEDTPNSLISKHKDVKFVATRTYSSVYSYFFNKDEYMYVYDKAEDVVGGTKIYQNRSRKITANHKSNVVINAFNEDYDYNVGDTVTASDNNMYDNNGTVVGISNTEEYVFRATDRYSIIDTTDSETEAESLEAVTVFNGDIVSTSTEQVIYKIKDNIVYNKDGTTKFGELREITVGSENSSVSARVYREAEHGFDTDYRPTTIVITKVGLPNTPFYICIKSYKAFDGNDWSQSIKYFELYKPTYYYKITENGIGDLEDDSSADDSSTDDSSVDDSSADDETPPPAFSDSAIGEDIPKDSGGNIVDYELYYDEECTKPVESTQITGDEPIHYTLRDLQLDGPSESYVVYPDIYLCDELTTYTNLTPKFLSEPVWQDINSVGTYRITSGNIDYYTLLPKSDITKDTVLYSDEECTEPVVQITDSAKEYNLVYGLVSDVVVDRLEQTYEMVDGELKLYTSEFDTTITMETPVYSDTALQNQIGVYSDYIPVWKKVSLTPKEYVGTITYVNSEMDMGDYIDYSRLYMYDTKESKYVEIEETLYYDENQGSETKPQKLKQFIPSWYDSVSDDYGKIIVNKKPSSDNKETIALYTGNGTLYIEDVYVKLEKLNTTVYTKDFDENVITPKSIIDGESNNISLVLYYTKQCKGMAQYAYNMLSPTGTYKDIVITFNNIGSQTVETNDSDIMYAAINQLKGMEIKNYVPGTEEYNSKLRECSTDICNNVYLRGQYINRDELENRYNDYRFNNNDYDGHSNLHTCEVYSMYRSVIGESGLPEVVYLEFCKYGSHYYITKDVTSTNNGEIYTIGICVGKYENITTFNRVETSEITEDEIQNIIIYKNIGDILYIKQDSFYNRNRYTRDVYKNILSDTQGISTETDAYSGVDDTCWLAVRYINKTYMFNLHEIERKLVTLDNIKSVYLVDDKTNETISTVQLFDPIQGYFPNNVLDNINYITAIDPVLNYEANTSKWGDLRVGFLWWDLSKVRYVDYHQGSLEYRRNNWGKQLSGSEIVINEWTKSSVAPTDGRKYITMTTFNTKTDMNDVFYYYWEPNPVSIGSNTREISAFDIANIINNPTDLGILWTAPVYSRLDEFQENALVLANYSTIISGYQAVLQYNIDSDKDVSDHSEWALIKENTSDDVPEQLWEKMKDSILGYKMVDNQKLQVPDMKLPERNQVGISFRPRQSMFKNLFSARENFIDIVNDIFATRKIGDASDTSSWLVDVVDLPKDYDDIASTYSELMTWTDEDMIGKRVLVKRDEKHNNIWTIYYIKDLNTYELVDYQKYNISKYLKYNDWYKDNEIKTIVPVDTFNSLDSVDVRLLEIGDIVKVIIDGRWYLYQWDGITIKNLVGVEKILLEVDSYVYEYAIDEKLSKTDEFIKIGETTLSTYEYIDNEMDVILNNLLKYFES